MTQKELGYIELEWTCKHCGTINPGMKRACTNCGAPIAKDDNFELPDQQELITDKEKLQEAKKGPAIHCPYCNTLNVPEAKICIQCGGDIEAGLARQAGEVLGAHDTTVIPDKPCPFCGHPVKANAQRCPNCGGNLVEGAQPDSKPAASLAQPKKFPIWMIVALIAFGFVCIASVIALAVLSSRTSAAEARVLDIHWIHSINILALQPVQKASWAEDVPSQAQEITCRDQYKETSNVPAPMATEVCGTPYVIDQGSGAGKVVQDCEYQVYASYCDYKVLEWTVVDTVTTQGNDKNPSWPSVNLLSGQKEGDRIEEYQVTFDVDGKTYTYSPTDWEEFNQFDTGSQWTLNINAFGQIKDLQRK